MSASGATRPKARPRTRQHAANGTRATIAGPRARRAALPQATVAAPTPIAKAQGASSGRNADASPARDAATHGLPSHETASVARRQHTGVSIPLTVYAARGTDIA